jgi:hypothetical protein
MCDLHIQYTDFESISDNLPSSDRLLEVLPYDRKILTSFKVTANASRFVRRALDNYHSFGKTEDVMDITEHGKKGHHMNTIKIYLTLMMVAQSTETCQVEN